MPRATVTVTSTSAGIDPVKGAIAVAYQPMSGLGQTPIVGLALGNAGLPIIVDTGSSFGIVAAPKDLAFVPTSIGLNETTKINYLIGAGDIVAGFGNVGNAFLSQFVVTFDFPKSTIYLDPISNDATVAPPTIPGATIGWDGKTAIVSSIAVGSYADKAELELGDVVTEVDGTPITTQPQFCAAFTGPAIQKITTKSGTFDAGIFETFFKTQ